MNAENADNCVKVERRDNEDQIALLREQMVERMVADPDWFRDNLRRRF